MLDMGANTECKPENLAQFALMGTIYMESVVGRKNPSVGLLNIGTEKPKAVSYINRLPDDERVKGINFIGNVEARDVPEGLWISWYVTLQAILYLNTPGLATSLFTMLKDVMMQNTLSKLAALVLKPRLRQFSKNGLHRDWRPLLGINGG